MVRRNDYLRLSTALICLIFLLSGLAHAQIFEATSDGNWSNGSTWKNGTSPGNELNVGETVIITPNTTVSLDQDLTFLGSNAILKVNDTLQGNQTITVPRGKIGGNNNSGLLDVNKVVVHSSNVLKLAGELKANVLEIDAPVNLVQSATLNVQDTLYLKSGELEIRGGSDLIGQKNFNLVLESGTVKGSFAIYSSYNLIFKGSSRKVPRELLEYDNNINLIVDLDQNSDSIVLNNKIPTDPFTRNIKIRKNFR